MSNTIYLSLILYHVIWIHFDLYGHCIIVTYIPPKRYFDKVLELLLYPDLF